MTADARLEKLFDDISRFVSDSRAIVARGAMLELSSLEGKVRALCESVTRLAPEEGARYADRLQQVFGEVEALGKLLVAQRDALEQEMAGLSGRQKANIAYRTAESIDGGKKEDD